LRESEQRRGVPLTDVLNITHAASKKGRANRKREIDKRKNHVIRATPVVTQMPVSWNTVLVRERRLRQQQQRSTSSEQHQSSIHDKPTSYNNKLSTQQQQETVQAPNSKLEDNVQATVSWWNIVLGYTLGAIYSSYNGMMSYFTGNNENNDTVSEDDCDPDNVLLTTDPLLLARKYLNKNNNETIKSFPLFTGLSSQTVIPHINNIISRVVNMVQCYTGSPVPNCLFEDALIAADYDGAALLPVGTVQWSPQQYSPNIVNITQSERNDHLHDWQLVSKSNDTFLYVRPYKDTTVSQYRGIL